MSNIMTAAMNKTPLIITAGNQTREMLLMEPWLMNVEPTILPRPWVKWSYQPVRAEDLPAAFMRAYAMALQPPAGPVFLSIPLDDCDKPATGPAVVRSVARRIGPDPDEISAFADALSSAKNPALIYGSGIARGEGWDTGIKLAEKLNVSRQAVSKWEMGTIPDMENMVKLGRYFDCSLDYLMNEEMENNTKSQQSLKIENKNLAWKCVATGLIICLLYTSDAADE